MTDSFVTQCPHCQTSFRVSHAQLSVARGVVRCGACLQVFNAAKQLLEQRAGTMAAERSVQAVPAPLPAPVPAPVPVPVPAPIPVVVLPANVPDVPILPPIIPALPVPAPAPIEPAPEQDPWEITELDLDSLDLDEELARLEQRENKPAAPFSDKVLPGSALTARRDQPQAEPEEWGSLRNDDVAELPELHAHEPEHEDDEVIEEPQAVAEPGGRTEPSLSLSLHDEELDEHGKPLPPLPPPRKTAEKAEKAGRWSAIDDENDEEAVEPVLTTASRTRRKRDEHAVREQSLLDLTDDPLQLDWQPPKPRWGRRLAWTFLCLLALAGLLGQYVWYHFDELARQDQYRPWFQQICPQIDCKVPSKVDITLLKSSNLVVRSHPEFKGALVVDAIIYNRAPFSQPFPLLELRFADTNGQLIASRRFKPGEYLSGEMAGKEEMPPQTPIHIALDILDPGAKAVNYSLSFRSPE